MVRFIEQADTAEEMRSAFTAWLRDWEKRIRSRKQGDFAKLTKRDQALLERELYVYASAADFWEKVEIRSKS